MPRSRRSISTLIMTLTFGGPGSSRPIICDILHGAWPPEVQNGGTSHRRRWTASVCWSGTVTMGGKSRGQNRSLNQLRAGKQNLNGDIVQITCGWKIFFSGTKQYSLYLPLRVHMLSLTHFTPPRVAILEKYTCTAAFTSVLFSPFPTFPALHPW